jgi:hypothetical protein
VPTKARGQRTVPPPDSVFGMPSNGRSSTLSVPSHVIAGTTTSTLERFSAWTRNGTVVCQRPERSSSR